MWKLTIRSPEGQPKNYEVKPGSNMVGRMESCDIFVDDISASRRHAEILYNQDQDTLSIRDLGSTNGTYVNQLRIYKAVELSSRDLIRIGNCIISLSQYDTGPTQPMPPSGTHRYTRELLLESLDQHAVLLYEAARKLNTVVDMDTALHEVSNLMLRAMGADKCEVILASRFGQLHDLGFPETIAQTVIELRSAVIIPDMAAIPDQRVAQSAGLYRIRSALCVPVISGEDLLALIYMYKTDPNAQPFEQRDLQLAVAISHQAALTIQRTELFTNLQRERQVQSLLRRFLSPREAEFLFDHYVKEGSLPGLEEQTVTILFADLADSTGLAERIGPQRFGEFLARYYQEATEIIFKYRGVIKFLGDGVMGVFSSSMTGERDEMAAVQAGQEIIASIERLDQEFPDQGISGGVAINSGQAVAGYVGTEDRVEYTVLGDVVNVAARLQAFARPNRLVLGPATMAAVVDQFATRRIGEVVVRGREKTIQIFEVLRSGKPASEGTGEDLIQDTAELQLLENDDTAFTTGSFLTDPENPGNS